MVGRVRFKISSARKRADEIRQQKSYQQLLRVERRIRDHKEQSTIFAYHTRVHAYILRYNMMNGDEWMVNIILQ